MNIAKSKEQFDNEGYLYFPGFLSPDEVTTIQSKLNAIIEEKLKVIPSEHIKYEGKREKSNIKLIQDLHLYDSFFEEVLHDSKFSKLAAELLEEDIVGKTVEYFNKPAKIGKATPPHQDGYYFMLDPMSAITLWIALEEVNEANGWVSYVKGSHLRGLRPHGKSGTIGFSQQIVDFGTPTDAENEVFMPVKAGDLLVHHALTIHRAAPNTSLNNSRKAMGLIYFGASAKEDIAAKKAYVASLNQNN